MSFNRARFLIELLGPDGARALAKAADRSDLLTQAIVPRTIMAWLRSMDSFAGEMPGAPGQTVSFSKSEDGFTGSVAFQGRAYEFRGVSLFHAASAIAVGAGIDSAQVPAHLKNTDLERLGKSIDMMVKTQRVLRLQKEESSCGTEESSPGDEHGETSRQEIYQKDELLEKKGDTGGSGHAAGPVAPAPPVAPTATAPQKSASPTTPQKLPKVGGSAGAKAKMPASHSYRLSQSEVSHPCSVCGRKQFSNREFVGCSCFRALAKSVRVLGHDDDGLDVQLGEGWDRETILTLLEAVGRK